VNRRPSLAQERFPKQPFTSGQNGKLHFGPPHWKRTRLIVFINDIVNLFGNDLKVKLYADDVKMYTTIHDISCASKFTR